MQAIVNTPGGPGRVALVADVPEPAPAPDEVVVAVAAFGINRGELALLAARTPGWRPGQDVVGTVVAPAADGAGPPVSTRVVGLVEQAGWAQRVAVPVGRLAVLGDDVDTATAATLGIAGRTALRTVALGGSLLGHRVLVTSAGTVGRFQVQLAALAGAHVVAVTGHDETRTALLAAGAVDVVAAVAQADGLFDLVLDTVGGRGLAAAITKVAPEGTVVLVGAADPQPAELTLLDFFGHENAAVRSYFSFTRPEAIGADLATLVGLVADGRLVAPVGLRGEWDTVNDALDALAAGRVDGKAVLTVP